MKLIQKALYIILILAFICFFFTDFNNNNNILYYNIENYENILDDNTELNIENHKNKIRKNKFDNHNVYDKRLFSSKYDNNIYDEYYAKHYDSIFLNKNRNNFELLKIMDIEKNKKHTKILDVGCGTGYHVNVLTKKGYNVEGIDKSSAMIENAKYKYKNAKYEIGDILDNGILDFSVYTHILCLGRTIYEIKDKETFFDNCFSLLKNNGYLIVHLINRQQFDPYKITTQNKIVYNPLNYDKKISQLIIKLDKNNEYLSKYKNNHTNNNHSDNDSDKDSDKDTIDNFLDYLDDNVKPYITFSETFKNFKTNEVKKRVNNLYMPQINIILDLAKSKNFVIKEIVDMKPSNYKNEYLYVFQKNV